MTSGDGGEDNPRSPRPPLRRSIPPPSTQPPLPKHQPRRSVAMDQSGMKGAKKRLLLRGVGGRRHPLYRGRWPSMVNTWLLLPHERELSHSDAWGRQAGHPRAWPPTPYAPQARPAAADARAPAPGGRPRPAVVVRSTACDSGHPPRRRSAPPLPAGSPHCPRTRSPEGAARPTAAAAAAAAADRSNASSG